MEISPAAEELVLLRNLQNGETDAYLHIYKRYHGPLYHYVLRFVKIPDLAEDIVQDVFVKLWEVRKGIKPELSIMGYLYRISRNLVFKAMKKIAADEELRTQVLFKLEELLPNALEDQLQWKEYEQILQHAILKLPPQRQKVFSLCRQQGKTYEETAALLGISHHTVKEHMMLAMKSIKDYVYNNADVALAISIAYYLKSY